MNDRPIVFFAMDEFGHFRGLLPVLAELCRLGVPAHVFTHPRYRDEVVSAGGRFEDLFEGRPLDAADDRSRPIPCRYVSFAGRFGSGILEAVRKLKPVGIVYDTFAVIGAVVGRALGIPFINVCGGHEITPRDYLESLARDPRVSISEECHRAVDALKLQLGFPEASPFSYVTALSPYLNLYSEPPQYLSPSGHRCFEPVGFFGALPAAVETVARDGPHFPADASAAKLYVSFGTVVTRYFREEALSAWRAVADFAGTRPVHVVISLAGTTLDPRERASLERPNVSVRPFVDQWSILKESTMFLTQHGMHSTHEALFHEVPMLSYPFFWDQPALARKCAELGTAVPVATRPREPLEPRHVEAAVARCLDSLPSMKAKLAEARAWEVATLANRKPLARRILELCSGGAPSVRS